VTVNGFDFEPRSARPAQPQIRGYSYISAATGSRRPRAGTTLPATRRTRTTRRSTSSHATNLSSIASTSSGSGAVTRPARNPGSSQTWC